MFNAFNEVKTGMPDWLHAGAGALKVWTYYAAEAIWYSQGPENAQKIRISRSISRPDTLNFGDCDDI